MITSQLCQAVEGFDEVVSTDDDDFADPGLKTESLIRLARLAVVDDSIVLGAIGRLSPDRLERITRKLADWVLGRVQV